MYIFHKIHIFFWMSTITPFYLGLNIHLRNLANGFEALPCLEM